jgi:diaminohydroxyphosphoribosylaminopyrimidine deaminase/5-amino-6-(5-phosphoribosylamino)uracil reductase
MIDTNEVYMREAVRLARKGFTSPNPMVGAVIVKERQVVGKGYHKKYGNPHAEVMAIRDAKDRSIGSTMYVNLEPCVHYGKTPPCCDAIIKAGIKRVYVSMLDPNPLVRGKGIEKLRSAGIDVVLGLCEKEARELNEAYIKYMEKGYPFVTMKIASTLDGKIATRDGESKWITGEKSRKFVHKLRESVDAVVVGINTIIKDDPLLTTRGEREPFRIVLDEELNIPEKARVLGEKCIIATTEKAKISRVKKLQGKARIWILKEEKGKVSLHSLLKRAWEEKLVSILVEGGGEVFNEFLLSGMVDKFYLFLAPRILGDGITWVKSLNIKWLKDSLWIKKVKYKKLEEDILIEGYLN